MPQPVGPTIAQNWPGSTVRLTSRIAVNGSPEAVMNRLVRCLISIFAGWVVDSAGGAASLASGSLGHAVPFFLVGFSADLPGNFVASVTVEAKP